RDLSTAVGPPHSRSVNRQFLPGEGHHTPLAPIPRVRAARLMLVPRPAQTRHLVLQDVRSDQQTQFDGQTLQGVLHQGQQLVPIEGELHLSVGVRPLGSTVRRLSLVSDPSVRIGSFQGGSSSSRVFWRPSSLATGREEPPLSISTMAGTSSQTMAQFVANRCHTPNGHYPTATAQTRRERFLNPWPSRRFGLSSTSGASEGVVAGFPAGPSSVLADFPLLVTLRGLLVAEDSPLLEARSV